MNEYSSRIIPEKFTCGAYKFQLYGDALTEITYKVTSLSYKKIEPDSFYTDIMYDEKINFYLGISVGCIIVDKKAYLNKVDETESYYMLLSLKVLELHDYYDSILNISTIGNIINDFHPTKFNKYRYPVSMSIDEFNINDNPFCNIFYTSINIFNVRDSVIPDVVDELYSNVICNITDNISSYINKSKLFKLGFNHRFIITHGYKSIKVTGFIIPNTIEGVHVLSISKNSIIIEESDKWKDNIFSGSALTLYNIIPYVYNTDNVLYNTFKIHDNKIKIINDKKYHKIDFDTLVFNLKDRDEPFSDNYNPNQINFILYDTISDYIAIYKNTTYETAITYIGYVYKGMENVLSEYVKNNFKNSRIDPFYNDNNKSYFIIRPYQHESKFKSIYNYIKTKFRLRW
jgi:hypothetical protein